MRRKVWGVGTGLGSWCPGGAGTEMGLPREGWGRAETAPEPSGNVSRSWISWDWWEWLGVWDECVEGSL